MYVLLFTTFINSVHVYITFINHVYLTFYPLYLLLDNKLVPYHIRVDTALI